MPANIKRKVTTIKKWIYKDRPMTIEIYDHAPKSFTFFGGAYIPTTKDSYSLSKISRVQKILRQKLWQYLTDNNLDNENYILKIDAPSHPSGSKVFLDLVICFTPKSISNITECEAVIEMFYSEMINMLQL